MKVGLRIASMLFPLIGACAPEEPAEMTHSPDGAEPPEVAQAPEGARSSGAAEEAPEAQAVRVEVARMEPGEARMQLRLPGEVEGGRDALLAAALGGFVERVLVDEGDRVSEGDVLVKVDSQLHAAEVSRVAAELRQAKRELERAERLEGSIPVADYESSETRLATARAAYRTARLRLSRARVRAPFDGVVAEVAVEQGEVAEPGSPVVRLVQLDPAAVKLSVSDRDVVAMREGTEVRIRTDARGEIYEGEVVHISPAADLQTRAFEVEVEVPNPDGELLPGMIAKVELASAIEGEHLILPQQFLVTRREGNGVFVIEDGRARWRPVVLGSVVGGQVVVEKGVAAGDRVVITGHRELADGDSVIVAREGVCCVDGRVRFGER